MYFALIIAKIHGFSQKIWRILLDFNLVNVISIGEPINIVVVTRVGKVFELLTEHLQRVDETDDSIFYSVARLVKHIDPPACNALADYFRLNLRPHSDILDLMSSYASHLPEELSFNNVVGLGMNEAELRSNLQLTDYVIQDLGQNYILPFDDNSFDACLITVSVQYLVKPINVFQEIARVLRSDCPCIVSFSNRCFPTKAVAIWHQLSDVGHTQLVSHYFAASGGYEPCKIDDISPNGSFTDPLFIVRSNTKKI